MVAVSYATPANKPGTLVANSFLPGYNEQLKDKPMNLDRITCDPARLNGQPCIRNLRLTVQRVLKTVATYPDREELRREYPELEDEDIHQAIEYASANLDDF